MTEAALDFLEEQLSARPIGEANWNEVIFMLTVQLMVRRLHARSTV